MRGAKVILLAVPAICLGTILLGSRPAFAQDSQDSQNSAPPAQTITLPAGSVISVRIADEVNSSHNHPGDLFTGTVDPSLLINDRVVIPRGTEAHLRMVDAKKGGHFHGKAEVTLELVSLIINGQRLGVDSDTERKEKSAIKAKTSAAAKKSTDAGGNAVAGNPGAVLGPVIAAFSAAKVEIKANSRIEFLLESPFTFEKPLLKTEQP
jgi:hypothetical protein